MDIKTIIFCLFIINLFLGIIILVIQQSHIDFKGFNFWTITNFMIATGYLFMGLRTKIPDFVSIVVANVLFLVAGIIRIYGFSFFFNRKIKRYQQVFLGMIFVIY